LINGGERRRGIETAAGGFGIHRCGGSIVVVVLECRTPSGRRYDTQRDRRGLLSSLLFDART
jgi:hypothetical protein